MPRLPHLKSPSRALSALVVTALASSALVAGAAPASAVACTGSVTYASTSNTIYVTDASHPWTLPAVAAACPSAPLAQVDPAAHVWELRADLVVQNGATLTVSGAAATDPVSELRLRSLSDSVATHVTQLVANHGTIDFTSTHVRSWDDAQGAPDSDPTLPSCPTGTPSSQCPRGRAFIRALSSLAADGTTWRESTLNFTRTEVDHLGYYAATAYGISYKTGSGCDHAHPDLCGHVFGKQVESDFHDNYMGTYTWGAKGMQFLRSQYHHNTMYGLDPHDVSNDLDIEGNHFSYNGDHGLICSQACDNLTIVGNESDHNGLSPWKGPIGDAADGQVHGIMLHRGITRTVVRDNTVHDQPNGAGIAIFDTAGATVSGNTVTHNKYGVRLSVGSSDNAVTNNTVIGSTQYGVYFFKGGDTPTYTRTGGRPTGNTFTGNTFSDSVSNTINLRDGDQNTFTGNTFSGTSPAIVLSGSRNTLEDNTFPSGQKISTVSSATGASSTTVVNPVSPVAVGVDSTSSADLVSAAGRLFTASGRTLATSATPSGSTLHLTSTILATTSTVTITPQPVTIRPASGTAVASTAGSGASRSVTLSEATPSPTTITFGGLTAGRTYKVRRSGVAITTATADAKGVATFTDTPPDAGSQIYTVVAA